MDAAGPARGALRGRGWDAAIEGGANGGTQRLWAGPGAARREALRSGGAVRKKPTQSEI